MKLEYSVEITKVAEEMMLEPVNLPDDIATRVIIRNDVSRPGLPLAGFFDHFESGRIQIIGNMEHKYIELLTHEQRMEALERFLSCGVVCIVVTRGLDIFPELSQLCEKYGTPLYLSHDTTSNFMAAPHMASPSAAALASFSMYARFIPDMSCSFFTSG